MTDIYQRLNSAVLVTCKSLGTCIWSLTAVFLSHLLHTFPMWGFCKKCSNTWCPVNKGSRSPFFPATWTQEVAVFTSGNLLGDCVSLLPEVYIQWVCLLGLYSESKLQRANEAYCVFYFIVPKSKITCHFYGLFRLIFLGGWSPECSY